MPAPTSSAILAIPTRVVNQGRDMAVYISPAEVLVTSHSAGGSWRLVNLVENWCTCPGYAARGRCRHLEGARQAESMEQEPVDFPDQCECGSGPYTVRMDGHLYCGRCAPTIGAAR